MSRPYTQCLPEGQLPEATPVEGGRSGYGQKTQQSLRAENREARMRCWTRAPAGPGADALRFPSPPQAGRQPRPAALRTPRHHPNMASETEPPPGKQPLQPLRRQQDLGKESKPQPPSPPRGADQPGSRAGLDGKGGEEGQAQGWGPSTPRPLPWGNGPHFGHFGSFTLMPGASLNPALTSHPSRQPLSKQKEQGEGSGSDWSWGTGGQAQEPQPGWLQLLRP